MKAEALAPGANVSQALNKGTCSICAILKDFQWTLAETALDLNQTCAYVIFTGGRSLDPERSSRALRLGKAQKLRGTMFAQWMKGQGTLCLEHGRKVKEFVPLRLRTLVDEIVERNRAELQQELESFLEQLKQGIHEGGGLLGRAAEFFVGQRGL